MSDCVKLVFKLDKNKTCYILKKVKARNAEKIVVPKIYEGKYVGYMKYDQGAIAPYMHWYPEYKNAESEKLYPTFHYQMDYWQFTDSCSIDGIGGPVDASLQFIRR